MPLSDKSLIDVRSFRTELIATPRSIHTQTRYFRFFPIVCHPSCFEVRSPPQCAPCTFPLTRSSESHRLRPLSFTNFVVLVALRP